METTSGAIDSHRPWIRDERDDPGQMNWAQTLFNPFGKTSKLHFSRAWTLMFMGRILLYVVPSFAVGVATMAGANMEGANKPVNLLLITVPALLVPFAVYTIATEFTSFVAHTRRLSEARRPAWLAIIVLVPMMLGLLAYNAGTVGGAAAYKQMNAPAPAGKTEEKKEGEGSETDETKSEDDTEEEKSDEAKAEEPKQQRARQQQQRRGPPGPPQSERQMAVSSGMSFGMMVWAPLSLIAMLWTLLYVARLPNGGAGRFRSGSDLTPEEIEAEA